MRCRIFILFGALTFALASCVHDPHPPSYVPTTNKILETRNMLAFRQQDEADLVVFFLDWNCLTFSKPSTYRERFPNPINKATFLQTIDTMSIERRFAVVVMEKPWAIAKNRVSLDELEAFFRGLGFQRVVFQQARSALNLETGFPILRDTAER